MCGIAGFVGPGDAEVLQAMSDALVHRGPDGAGRHLDGERPVFLAHRRLAILDVAGGEQPMWNEDHQVGIVFNGEIYNHLELRRELVAAGHVFRSDHSDTEVLVHGYEEWGEDLPLRLSGMFAFAIYDRRRRRLFLARDRFGKKPLYYTSTPGFFAFASELGALRQHPRVDGGPEPRALRKYFAYGFIPAPHSLYRGVRKLPGGHWLMYDVDTGTLRTESYWTFRIEPEEPASADPVPAWCEELRELLSAAVKRRLISDVPLGIFLSGGIDSSAVLAFAVRHMPAEQAKTFSIGFNEPSFDESAWAQRVAAVIGSDHRNEMLDIDMAADLVPHVLSQLDEPMADSSILPTYLVSRFARREVTVALGGDGGDEMFAGYDPFKALRWAERYQALVPHALHRGIRCLADLLPASERNMSLDFKLKRTLRGLSHPPSHWNPVWLGPLEPSDLEQLFREPVDPEEVYDDAIQAWNGATATDTVDRTLEFYTRFYLQDDILTKVDRASMMVSLEVRAPFLDNDVVEFARRIPHRYKLRNGQTKYLLKKALEPVLPHDVIHRPKKGFGVPMTRWMKAFDAPGPVAAAPAADAEWVKARWREHRACRADHRLLLWSWTVLQHHRPS